VGKDKADRALRRRTVKGLTFFFLLIGVFSVVVTWWLFAAKLSFISVRGESMEPTFKNGDSVVLKQAKAPEPGMIFVFDKPKSWNYMGTGERVLIKRVAAVPGQTLSYDGKAFMVDGKPIYTLADQGYECKAGPVGYKHTLTKQEVFVMGDNSLESLDSRRIFCDGHPENAYIGSLRVVDFGTVERVF